MKITVNYSENRQLTKHISTNEVKCKCRDCHNSVIDMELLNNIEKLIEIISEYTATPTDKILIYISSAYRCCNHDRAVGGSGAGTHTTGNAIDFCIYVNGTPYDNKYIAAIAKDMGCFTGIGRIDNYYIHLDNAPISAHGGKPWFGDETVIGGTNGSVISESENYWNYYKITKPETANNDNAADTIEISITLNNIKYRGVLTAEKE